MNIINKSILTFTFLISFNAISQEMYSHDFSGSRIGIGASNTIISENNLDYGSGVKLEYGYEFNRIVGINLSYEANNGDLYSYYNTHAEFEGSMLKVTSDLGYTFDFNKWTLKPYGIVGLAKYNEDGAIYAGSQSVSTSFSETNPVLGFGIRATLDFGLYLDLRSEYIPVSNMELGQGSITAGYKF
ncbi:outer membrane beta-barrel protein [Aliivibrio fischeri]|uniref:porin family protein n=1 Tax=Aliivibrio fischeri TaxID=668 RepID=UPI0012D988D2|nr:porin family protein [Aliivibrio fischeri]MUK75648.1 outer membrane beta-barrel protein [Aliivibrio fischeri]